MSRAELSACALAAAAAGSSPIGGSSGRTLILARACCPRRSEEFERAVASSLGDEVSVRWVTIGRQCQKDGALGIYADWKIDYSSTDHLLTVVQV